VIQVLLGKHTKLQAGMTTLKLNAVGANSGTIQVVKSGCAI